MSFRRHKTCNSSLRFIYPPSPDAVTRPSRFNTQVGVTRKLRLLVASQPLDAGVPHHVLDLVHGLDRDRFRIVVAAPRQSVLWAALEGDPEVELHAISPCRRPAPAGDTRSLAQLARLARGADVIHVHSAKAGFIGRLGAALGGRARRCVFTPHGWSFWSTDGPARRIYLELERRAARWCRTIVAVGEFERAAGLEAGIGRPEQYRVVPNGIDVDRFAGERRPVPGRVLMVGRLAAPKRQDLAVEAIMRVRRSHPEAELHLVGDGPLRRQLESRIAALGAGEAVRLLGTRSDLPDLLAGADCVLLASDYEGAPLSILEAMAAGAPIVASRVAGIPELVLEGETGLLVEPQSAAGIAGGLERVLGDRALAARLGEAGRLRARAHYSRERMVRDLTAVYDEALR
jgi:glycosyltransferase involved in cell wall biosynthesis